MNARAEKLKQANRRLALKLGVVTVAMFGFGYALVPLYYLFCDITGLGGKTGRVDARIAAESRIDTNRTVTVEFTGHAATGLPWEFRPLQSKVTLHPGETKLVEFYARNRANESFTGQAVPSVAPNQAARFFKKIECFCFTQQVLNPDEARKMPVRFMVTENLPKDVKLITLSYTFFKVDQSLSVLRNDGVISDRNKEIPRSAQLHAASRTGG
jgi:cytochrome c oxidase assembly protein subunit 11